MKTYHFSILAILSVVFILGCSFCGVTIPLFTVTSTPTSIPATQTQPSVDQIQILFMADRASINVGECALLQWSVQGPAPIIQLDIEAIPPIGQKQVCPTMTTTYILIAGFGTPQLSKYGQVVINVSEATQTPTITLTPTKIIIPLATATKSKSKTPTVTMTSPPPPPGGGSWGPTGTDIQIVNVGSSSATGVGKIYIDIKNNGPKEFSGDIEYLCQGTSSLRAQPTTIIPFSYGEKIKITLSIGTGFFYTNLVVYPDVYSYPAIHCVITVPNDPEPGNNSGTLSIP